MAVLPSSSAFFRTYTQNGDAHSAYCRASLSLGEVKVENFDQQLGVSIIKEALSRPMRVIAENSGKEGGVVIGNLLEKHSGDFAMYVLATRKAAYTILSFDGRLISVCHFQGL